MNEQHEQRIILAQPSKQSSAQPKRHPWLLASVATTLLLGMVAAFGTAPDTRITNVERQLKTESLAIAPEAAESSTMTAHFVREERIRSGDSVPMLLSRLGISNETAVLTYLRSDKSAAVIFRQLGPGKTITAQLDGAGNLSELMFPLNGLSDQVLVVRASDDGFASSTERLEVETQIQMKSAEIRQSLFGATDESGIPDGIAAQLADVFGGDIDFHRDLRKGDRFAVVYETMTHRGREIRGGKLLAAEFINNGKTFQASWFGRAGGDGGYYSRDGKNLRKAFLRSPLEFSRITSGFSSARFHPVLQSWRAHKGIDYGAPTGTRVRSTGNGVVEFAGTRGGYGKVVVLRHPAQYTTLYAHLSGFAPGLRAGTRVSQGDTVGFVGATGLASGPHLHYEFQVKGIHQNPLAMTLPTAPPLAVTELSEFHKATGVHFSRIDRIRDDSQKLALVN